MTIIRFDGFLDAIHNTPLEAFSRQFEEALQQQFFNRVHGDMPKWLDAIQQLPPLTATSVNLDSSAISLHGESPATPDQQQQLIRALKALHPWRKGPFHLFGIDLNTEWRSDWKWDRVEPHLSPLENRTVLDVGCGSGYHCWRMRGKGARFVLGIDPSPKFLMQFLAIQHYIQDEGVQFLPLRSEDLPTEMRLFDTTFSMGILYHRKSPFDHLEELKGTLKPGGELVLETLVVEGDINTVLVPGDRYAQMRNVFFIPSPDALCHWLDRAGFTDIKLVDLNRTSLQEQRSTEWMTFHSLKEFLDPEDQGKTIEGYPAPLRATVVAKKPVH